MSTLEENLVLVQPCAIEPRSANQKLEQFSIADGTKGSINGSHVSVAVESKTTITKPVLPTQIVTALSVSLVSMVVGMMNGYTSPAGSTIKKELHVTEEELSWVAGIMPLGALLGGCIGGPLVEFTGRKSSIIVTDILFLIAWATIATSVNVWWLYGSRFVGGIAVGIASLALPVYLGETLQPEVRGTLGLMPTALGNIGILVCYVIGSYLPWNQLAWVSFAFPIPFFILAFFIPETPRWYISKRHEEDAHNALQWLRGKETDIQDEFGTLVKSQKNDLEQGSLGLAELFTRANMKPLLISLGLMFFQQFSGINAVIYYTTDIFEMTGSTIEESLCTIIVGVVNFVSTFIATIFIDRVGRKVLLYISSMCMTITLGILGTYFFLKNQHFDVSAYGWIPLVSFVIYVLSFSLGFGPIPWLMLGEILPARIRGSAAAFATAFNWTCTFVVTKTFVDVIALLNTHGTFWGFGIICVLSLVFVVLYVPETQGQSLLDIERKLTGLEVRRISSVANLKPLPSTM